MKRFLYAFYIILVIVVLVPKEKLYFTFETFISEYHLYINNEVLTNHILYLDIDNGEVLLDNSLFGTIENIRITPWIFINRITISNLSISPLYRTFFPGKIESMNITYSLLHPLEISIYGEGDFGHFIGRYDLINKKMRVIFEATTQLRSYGILVSKLHQEKEGLVYESNF